jgi:hypothetical protein
MRYMHLAEGQKDLQASEQALGFSLSGDGYGVSGRPGSRRELG